MSLKATRTVDVPKSSGTVQDTLKKARTIDLTLRAMQSKGYEKKHVPKAQADNVTKASSATAEQEQVCEMFECDLPSPASIFDIDERQAFKNRRLDEMPSFILERAQRRDQGDISIIKEKDLNDSSSFFKVARNLVNPEQVLLDSNELKNSLLDKSFVRS